MKTYDDLVKAYAEAAAVENFRATVLWSFVNDDTPKTLRIPTQPIVDPITRLEKQVAEYERQVQEYEALADLYQKLNGDLARERDILATRCAAQAHEIARLLAPLPVTEPEPDPVFAAIDVQQRQGVR